jgi:hypothetical protein
VWESESPDGDTLKDVDFVVESTVVEAVEGPGPLAGPEEQRRRKRTYCQSRKKIQRIVCRRTDQAGKAWEGKSMG